MTMAEARFGDSHNFGRRVAVGEDRVAKPRTLYWEWLLLSTKSPLRKLLGEAASREGLGAAAFSFLLDLEFFPSRPEMAREVERIQLTPLRALGKKGRRELAEILGRAVALFSWLGLSDLHWENLVLGADGRGRVIFSPLDVEVILADLSFPTETKLLPDADPEYAEISRHAAGARRVLPFLGKPIDVADLVAMAGAYHLTLSFLDRHASGIAAVFAGLPGTRSAPIRVLLRGTDEYDAARREPIWPPLLEAEAEQLARGDVPYFFRLLDRKGIHYYGNRALTDLRKLPEKGDVPRLDPILSAARGFRSPKRKKLREEGLFTLLGAFDDPSYTGRHESEGLAVDFQKRTLVVTLDAAIGRSRLEGASPPKRAPEELRAGRNLRAFVGSVYLPCRCGEVRTVFVPEVTVCRSSRRARA